MRAHLARLWSGVVRFLSRQRPPSCRHRLVRTPERLEDRLALSTVLPGAPLACACPFCAPGATLSTGDTGDAYSTYDKWTQAGGLGSTLTITYSYSNLLDGGLGGGLASTTIRTAIQEALSRWAAVAPLRFIEVPDSGPAPSSFDYDGSGSAMIRFGRRAIDGSATVLAYGYFPGEGGLAGDIQFDTAERWSVNPATGMDLLEVATHEIGHALGLQHQAGPTAPGRPAIMNPVYASRFSGLGSSFLLTDDINGIRSLYGSGQGSVTPLGGGTNPTPTPAPVSPFVISGTTLTVRGTAGVDLLIIDGSSKLVSINGQLFTGNLAAIRTILFNGLDGDDQAQLTGTVAAETFDLRPDLVRVTGPIRTLTLWNTERVEVRGGTGDVLVLRDSADNDSFWGTPNGGRMVTPRHDLSGQGFAHVIAIAAAGYDEAWLTDSTGNDTLWATGRITQLSGPGYSLSVRNFESVHTEATGGEDHAYLVGSAAQDRFITAPAYAQMTSLGTVVLALDFDKVESDGRLGFDVAYMYDSAGDDTFAAMKTSSVMYGEGYRQTVYACEVVYGFASQGTDRALVYDSAARDTFQVNGDTGSMAYGTSTVHFTAFDAAVVSGLAGSLNRRLIVAPGLFSIDWIGLWA